MSKEKFKRALHAELNKVVDGVDKPVGEYLATSVAAPMAQAIEASLAEAAQTDLSALFGTLKTLDGDMQELRRLDGSSGPSKSTYESWARYWAAVSPDLEVVRKLVREVVLPKLDAVRAEIEERSMDCITLSFGPLRGVMLPLAERLDTIRIDSPMQAGDLWRRVRGRAKALPEPNALSRIFNLGAKPADIVIRCDCKDAIDDLYYTGRPTAGSQGMFYVSAVTALNRKFEYDTKRCRLIYRVDAEASEYVPNARFEGFGVAFGECAAALYGSALTSLAESVPVTAKVRGWSGPLGMFDRNLSPAAALAISLLPAYLCRHAHIAWILLVFALCFGALTFLSRALLYRHLRDDFGASLLTALEVLDGKAAEMTARAIDESFMDRVLARITVKLSPRPLQRALNRSLD